MRKLIPFTVALAFVLGMAVVSASAAKITGKVTDKDGKAVADAQVMVFKAPAKPNKKAQAAFDIQVLNLEDKPAAPADKPKPEPVAKGTTGADGTYSLDGIAAGDYIVRAGAKGVGGGQAKVTVADADVVVDIKLEAPKPKPAK